MSEGLFGYQPIDVYAEQLRSGGRRIQFASLPPDSFLGELADLMRSHPDAQLRVFGGYDGSITNLDGNVNLKWPHRAHLFWPHPQRF
jgi:hypothetical protein